MPARHGRTPGLRAGVDIGGTVTDVVVFDVGQEHSVAVRMPSHVGDEAERAQVKRLFDEAHLVMTIGAAA